MHRKLCKTYVARFHTEIRACHKSYRASATLVGIVVIVLSFDIRLVEYGLENRRGFAVRRIVDVMFDDNAFAHIHTLFDVHFFGEGRVKRVGVVNGKNEALLASGYIIVFGFAEPARDFFKHGLHKRRVCALLGSASDLLVVEASTNCDVLRICDDERGESCVYAGEIVDSRRAEIFAVCAASER